MKKLIILFIVIITTPSYANQDSHMWRILNLADYLGNIQYLDTLCYGPTTTWSQAFQIIMNLEELNDQNRRKSVSDAYNDAYNIKSAIYSHCKPSLKGALLVYKRKALKTMEELSILPPGFTLDYLNKE